MQRNKLYLFGGLLVTLSLVAACGRSARAVPTVDSSARETSLAATAVAFGTATPSPAPTETPIPTAVVSSYGTSVTEREDGSTLFTDQRAGIQITFPPSWLAMRVGEPEYYKAWEKEGAQNPVLLDAITSTQNLDLNTFRITAFDMNSEHVLYDNIPKINVVFLQNDTRILRQVEYDERTKKSILSNYKFLPSEFRTMSSGLEVLIIQHQWKATSSTTHESFTGYYKGFIFKVPTGIVAIDLFIPIDLKESLGQELEQIVESITMLGP